MPPKQSKKRKVDADSKAKPADVEPAAVAAPVNAVEPTAAEKSIVPSSLESAPEAVADSIVETKTVVEPEAAVVAPGFECMGDTGQCVLHTGGGTPTYNEPEAAVVEPEAAVVEPEAAVVEPEAAVVEPEAAVVEPEAPSAAASAPPPKKRRTKPAAEGGAAKRRNISGFVLFQRDFYATNQDSLTGLDFKEKSKRCGDAWRELTDDAQAEFRGKADEMRGPLPEKKPKPTRTTSFFLYVNEQRSKLKEENPSLQTQDIAKLAGTMWRELTDEEKKVWADKATEQNNRVTAAVST